MDRLDLIRKSVRSRSFVWASMRGTKTHLRNYSPCPNACKKVSRCNIERMHCIFVAVVIWLCERSSWTVGPSCSQGTDCPRANALDIRWPPLHSAPGNCLLVFYKLNCNQHAASFPKSLTLSVNWIDRFTNSRFYALFVPSEKRGKSMKYAESPVLWSQTRATGLVNASMPHTFSVECTAFGNP